MTASRVLRVPRETLAAAVSPEPLDVVLDGLVTVGAIHGYEERDGQVLVWGDITAMQAAIEQVSIQDSAEFSASDRRRSDGLLNEKHTYAQRRACTHPMLLRDGRREYYAACRAFMHDSRYRRLPAISKRIWALHAEGGSWAQIAAKLKVTVGKVREAVRGARILAGLPETVHATPRGGGTGCKTPFVKCSATGCDLRGSWRGKCSRHYQQSKADAG